MKYHTAQRCIGFFTIGTISLALTGGVAAADQSALKSSCDATWYTAKKGAKTANGDTFDPNKLTAAATSSFAFGTKVKVSYKSKSVTVKINDRGGFGKPVCLDLTPAAFDKLADRKLGRITVTYSIDK